MRPQVIVVATASPARGTASDGASPSSLFAGRARASSPPSASIAPRSRCSAPSLLLLTQTIEQHAAIEAIDWNTLGLLAGMMLMVKVTEPTGVYTWLAIRAGQLSRGRPLWVVVSLAGTTAVLSAFLDNLTTVLLMVPITFLLADALDIDPIPLVVIEILVSNIGGTATLIGDPPNILIAGATDLSFMAFIVNLAPVAVIHVRRRDRAASTWPSGASCRSRPRRARA